jgi:hypothetical protein
MPSRLDVLRKRLLPAGTRMADVPPDWRGLSYGEWLELQALEALELRCETEQLRKKAS